MATVAIFPHIEKTNGEPAHLQRIPRVRVAQIAMDYLFHGWSVDEMCRHHPYLQLAEAHAAMTYYFDHVEEIDAEIQAEIQQSENERKQAFPSAIFLKLKSKGLI
jgi:uncharacterized protein (DUF433 family)